MDNLKAENSIFPREWEVNYGGKLFTIGPPAVMGIVNCTPDSFVPSSRKNDLNTQIELIEKHLHDGATWLDIGAYSSRSGAMNISVQEEIDRLGPVIEVIRSKPIESLISIDTFRSEVAEFVLKQVPATINDITAGLGDEKMFEIVAKYRAPIILMHMKGTPQNMQTETNYVHLFNDIYYYFSERIQAAKNAGIKDIVLDPGFGFAKTTAQNFELLKQTSMFQSLGHPLLIGLSRKSMIYKTLGVEPEQALNGTTALNMIALQQGANILRVHDVKEANEVIQLYLSLRGE